MRQIGHWAFLLALSLAVYGLGLQSGSNHAAVAQSEATATPDPEGIIYSLVNPNDSLWAIAARAGISLEELLALNNLAEDAVIQPGQRLIVGYVPPTQTPTPVPPTATPTPTRRPPTPTPTATPLPRTAVCLSAFADLDRDSVHDAGEPFRAAVAFTVFNEEAVVANYVTDGASEPHCLEGMAPGDYKITRSVGQDESLTTAGNWEMNLVAGDVLNLEFGSFSDSDPLIAAGGENGVSDAAINESAAAAQDAESAKSTGNLLPAALVILALLLVVGLIFAANSQGSRSIR